jgi:hypothetical protein
MNREPTFVERHKKLVASTLLAGLAVSGCANDDHQSRYKACDKFGVVAQNRWAPLGAAVRSEPDIASPKVAPGFAGNETIAVDGWAYTTAAYPNNSPPYNSNIWFHLANREGWVTFAAVRGETTAPDRTGQANGGEPAPTPADCREDYQP